MFARPHRFAHRYEVITDGATPYGELDNGQVMMHVCTGKAPEVPKAADPGQAELLSKCWAAAPSDRPNFDQIAEAAQHGWQERQAGGTGGAKGTAVAAIAAAYTIPRSGAVASRAPRAGSTPGQVSAETRVAVDEQGGEQATAPVRDAQGYAAPSSIKPSRAPAHDGVGMSAPEPKRDANGYATPLSATSEALLTPKRDADGYAAPSTAAGSPFGAAVSRALVGPERDGDGYAAPRAHATAMGGLSSAANQHQPPSRDADGYAAPRGAGSKAGTAPAHGGAGEPPVPRLMTLRDSDGYAVARGAAAGE